MNSESPTKDNSCWHVMFCLSDVVISFVKKTVAGVAGLLRLRNPLQRQDKPRHYEETQVCTHTPSVRCAFQIDKGTLQFIPDKKCTEQLTKCSSLWISGPVLPGYWYAPWGNLNTSEQFEIEVCYFQNTLMIHLGMLLYLLYMPCGMTL